ncbi:MAG: hypothetical protein ACJZ5P_07120 [Candidatus Thalassarchaeaceae archaeon]
MMVAAGAIFWTIHTRADSAWVTGFAVMALAGMMGMTYDVTVQRRRCCKHTGAGEMASSIASSGHEVVSNCTGLDS